MNPAIAMDDVGATVANEMHRKVASLGQEFYDDEQIDTWFYRESTPLAARSILELAAWLENDPHGEDVIKDSITALRRIAGELEHAPKPTIRVGIVLESDDSVAEVYGQDGANVEWDAWYYSDLEEKMGNEAATAHVMQQLREKGYSL